MIRAFMGISSGFFQMYLHVFSKYVVPNTNNTVSCFYILRLNNQFEIIIHEGYFCKTKSGSP